MINPIDTEKWLKKNTIKCKHLKARITIKQCVLNQKIARNQIDNLSLYASGLGLWPCKDCKKGQKYYDKTLEQPARTKVCELFLLNPSLCSSQENGGIFTENKSHRKIFDKKKSCSPRCADRLSSYKQIGRVKAGDGTFWYFNRDRNNWYKKEKVTT